MGKYSAEQIMRQLDGNELIRRTDFDGVVNVTDLLDLLAVWGLNPGHAADFNGDDMVNVTDLLLLLANWG